MLWSISLISVMWMEGFWILGHEEHPRSYPLLFRPQLLSVYQNNPEGYSRTQNKVVAWHWRWNVLMENHVGVFKIIREIQKEQNRTEIIMTKFIYSTDQSKNRRTNITEKEKNLKRILNNQGQMYLNQFISALALRFKY